MPANGASPVHGEQGGEDGERGQLGENLWEASQRKECPARELEEQRDASLQPSNGPLGSTPNAILDVLTYSANAEINDVYPSMAHTPSPAACGDHVPSSSSLCLWPCLP